MIAISREEDSTKLRSARNRSWRNSTPFFVARYSPAMCWTSPSASIDFTYSETPATVIPSFSARPLSRAWRWLVTSYRRRTIVPSRMSRSRRTNPASTSPPKAFRDSLICLSSIPNFYQVYLNRRRSVGRRIVALAVLLLLLSLPVPAPPASAAGVHVSVLVDFGDGTYFWADVDVPDTNQTALRATELANVLWGLP